MIKKLILVTVIILCFTTIVPFAMEDMEAIEPLDAKARVLQVEDMGKDPISQFDVQLVQLEIFTGKYNGEILEIENTQSGNPVYDVPVKEGDKVVLLIEELEGGNIEVNISDYSRDTYIYFLVVLFLVVLLVIGRFNGFKTIITLGITMIAIFKILLPLILKGYSPIPITVFISALITILSLIIISGVNKKSLSAILGTVSGVVIAGSIAFFIGTQVKLTGLSSEEAMMLLYIPQNINFNFKDLLFSGILLGALGAVMDVSMSIASSIDEINKANYNLSRKNLFLSGMNVGKDIMGTMSNTLILAYTGSSVPLILLFMAYDTSLIKIMNLDIVATEIIRSLAGSIGLVLTIPITAAISSFLLKNNKN